MKRKSPFRPTFFNLCARICLALACAAISAHANIITVTNTNDSGPGSLRQALGDANNGDMINFDPALKGQTITLTTAELVINKNIAISGLGAELLAVSRAQNAPAFRIFHVLSANTVVIQGLTISNGLAAQFGLGGGILNEGSTLSVINCAVSGNSTDSSGGGISDGFLTEAHLRSRVARSAATTPAIMVAASKTVERSRSTIPRLAAIQVNSLAVPFSIKAH